MALLSALLWRNAGLPWPRARESSYMETGDRMDTALGPRTSNASDVDESRRAFLQAAGLLVAGLIVPTARADPSARAASFPAPKILLVVIGGVRRAETFSPEGL